MMARQVLHRRQVRLLIDLRFMTGSSGQAMHGNGTSLVNLNDDIQLEIKQYAKGTGTVNCHKFIISEFPVQDTGQTATIPAELNICSESKCGPQEHSIQHSHRGADQIGEDAVTREPALQPLLWKVQLRGAHLPDLHL